MSSEMRELIAKWRDDAKRAANGPMCDGESEYAVAGTYIACADELEALLARTEAGAADAGGMERPNGRCLWFPVNVLGGPMREYAPGKWESATWPSDAAPVANGADGQLYFVPHDWLRDVAQGALCIDDAETFIARNFQPAHPEAAAPAADGAVADALNIVNEAANRDRHAGNYAAANALVRARVTLYKATHPHDASAVTEAMVERAMNASMPGGSTAWVWLFNCEGGMRPEDKHRDWFRRVLTAALPSPRKEKE